MRINNILLIAPTYIDQPNTMYFPVGMSYLASYISSKGYSIDGYNMNNSGYIEGLKEIKQLIETNNYEVIGIGGLITAFSQIEKLIKDLRKITCAKIVIGGGITSCEKEIVLNTIKPDFMILSEGEIVFETLLKYIESEQRTPLPKGIWAYNQGEIEINSESNIINNLDDLPFPNYEIMGIEKFLELQKGNTWEHHKADISKENSMPISASRSCPFKCTFCHHAGMEKYRKHSVKYVINFIKTLIKKYEVITFSIYDELFSLNKKRVMEFCKEVEHLNINFLCQLRVDQVDDEMLEAMKNAGCIEISYGIESGSDTILKSMQKKITTSKLEYALNLTKKNKIGIQGNFLFGDPAETEDTLKDSLEFQKKNNLNFVDWSMVIPYPDTDLHKMALQKGLIKNRLKFIKNVAQISTYLWNKPINLTKFTQEKYLIKYAELRELNDKNHRKVLSIITESKKLDKFNSYMKIKCPHCYTQTDYKRLPFPLNQCNFLHKDRESFFGFQGINLICPNCRDKHYLIPRKIPHINELFEEFDQKLVNFINNNHNDIVIMPAIDRYYNAISEDTNFLKVKPFAVLDSRKYRLNNIFLEKPIEELTDENIKKYQSKKFFILPWVEADDAIKKLKRNNIKEKNILSWN